MTKASERRRLYGFCVVLLGCLIFAVRGYYDQTQVVHSRDFKPVYGGARCLIDGCDPYDSVQVEQAFLRHGGDRSDPMPFVPYYASYPPSALFLVIPLALLPFGVADLIWLGIGIVLFSAAALAMADLCVGKRALVVQCVLAAFVVESTVLIMLAQPAMLSISLAVIAAWCFLRGRWAVVGVLAFAVSLTLKPQVGALLWLFFMLASHSGEAQDAAAKFRRRALETLVATVLLMAPGILLAFHHPASADWPRELHANLVGMTSNGNFSDPRPNHPGVSDLSSLQTVFSLISQSPRFYEGASIAVFTPLFLAWLYLVIRRVRDPDRLLFGVAGFTATRARDVLALATAATLGFLPFYHRQYDTRLLLIMFPAIAVVASSDRVRGKLALTLGVLSTITLSHQFLHPGPRLAEKIVRLPAVARVAFDRPLPLTILLLSCLFLYCMVRQAVQEPRA